jgi:hypothetical protein
VSASWLAIAAAWLSSRYYVISAEFGTVGELGSVGVGVLVVGALGVVGVLDDEEDEDGGTVVGTPVDGGAVVVVGGTVVVGASVVVVGAVDVLGGGVVVSGGGAVVLDGADEDGSGWATDAGAPPASTTATTSTTTRPRMHATPLRHTANLTQLVTVSGQFGVRR